MQHLLSFTLDDLTKLIDAASVGSQSPETNDVIQRVSGALDLATAKKTEPVQYGWDIEFDSDDDFLIVNPVTGESAFYVDFTLLADTPAGAMSQLEAWIEGNPCRPKRDIPSCQSKPNWHNVELKAILGNLKAHFDPNCSNAGLGVNISSNQELSINFVSIKPKATIEFK